MRSATKPATAGVLSTVATATRLPSLASSSRLTAGFDADRIASKTFKTATWMANITPMQTIVQPIVAQGPQGRGAGGVPSTGSSASPVASGCGPASEGSGPREFIGGSSVDMLDRLLTRLTGAGASASGTRDG